MKGSQAGALPPATDGPTRKTRPSGVEPGQGASDVGKLLRSAYRQMEEEPIPSDILDLLNKLE